MRSHKIYCASDLHLGYERTNYTKINLFFDAVRDGADTLILCGDTFDLWRMPVERMGAVELQGLTKCIQELNWLVQNIPTVIIPGNHDYNLHKHLGQYPHIQKCVSPEIESENIFYTHGWKFDVQQRRFSCAYGWLVTAFPYLYQLFFKKPARMGLDKRDAYGPRAEEIHHAARNFAIKHRFDHVVMGHTHVPGIYGFGKVVDCGDFVDSCSYVVIVDGKPEVRYIE